MVITIRRAAVLSIACSLSFVLGVAPAHAAPVPAISYTGSLTSGRADDDYTVGNEVLVGSQGLVVSALGVQDINGSGALGTGLNSPVTVGLWNASGTTLLAMATVDNSDPAQAGGYRYASISPITLTAGTDYLIGAYVGGGIQWFGDGGSSPEYAGNLVTIENDVYSAAVGLNAPLSAGGMSIDGPRPTSWQPPSPSPPPQLRSPVFSRPACSLLFDGVATRSDEERGTDQRSRPVPKSELAQRPPTRARTKARMITRSPRLRDGLEHIVMIVPMTAHVSKAHHITQKRRQHEQQRRRISHMRRLHLQHHDRDDDGNHPASKRLQPIFFHAESVARMAKTDSGSIHIVGAAHFCKGTGPISNKNWPRR
jgi:hypothetical protein